MFSSQEKKLRKMKTLPSNTSLSENTNLAYVIELLIPSLIFRLESLLQEETQVSIT